MTYRERMTKEILKRRPDLEDVVGCLNSKQVTQMASRLMRGYEV